MSDANPCTFSTIRPTIYGNQHTEKNIIKKIAECPAVTPSNIHDRFKRIFIIIQDIAAFLFALFLKNSLLYSTINQSPSFVIGYFVIFYYNFITKEEDFLLFSVYFRNILFYSLNFLVIFRFIALLSPYSSSWYIIHAITVIPAVSVRRIRFPRVIGFIP